MSYRPPAPRPSPIARMVAIGALVLMVPLLALSVCLAPRSAPAASAKPTAVAVQPTAAPVATQAPAPTAAPTLPPAPTSPPATEPPAPTAAPAPPAAERVAVTGAGTDGVNMRAEPAASAARVKLLRDGHQLEIAGENRDAGGRTWRNVRDPGDGAIGWIAAEFVGAPGAAVAAAAPTTAPAPTAKPASKPGTSPEVQAYMAWLAPKMQLVGQSATTMSEQLGQFSRTPSIFLDQDWQRKTGVALGLMKGAAQLMKSQEREVPPAARTLDTDVRKLGDDLVVVADEFAAGLSTLDQQRMNRGNQRMTTARASLDRVTAGIQALQKSP